MTALIILGVIVALIPLSWLLSFFMRPTNTRVWSPDQEILSYADISDNLVTIHNIRNFTYRSTADYTPGYYDATFDLDKISSLDYVVEPFSKWKGAAHTFLTFGFESGRYVSISIEIRKQKGAKFSAIAGLFKQYEIMYVIADERDVIKLRSNFRKDQVYIYPIKKPVEKIRAIFLDMIHGANHLKEHPEWYNTLTNTCSTKIAMHINKISPKRIPFSYMIIFPGYSDRLVYNLGMIDTSLPFEELRAGHVINEKAMKYADAPDFSVRIRE